MMLMPFACSVTLLLLALAGVVAAARILRGSRPPEPTPSQWTESQLDHWRIH